ncbi:transposase family protein [Rhodococcus erythropolis]|uniref:transposase family protein n=1 Tax=Rhodococcus erythropolis TaxID=1833 RepID=UPI003798CF75
MSTSASCPTCGVSSKRVHSLYERMLADTAIAGRSSYVVLQVRRFLCSNTDCERRTFVEQVDGLTKAYARTTPLLREILEKITLALAGRAGSRLASTLGVSRRALSLIDKYSGAAILAQSATRYRQAVHFQAAALVAVISRQTANR